MDIAVLSEKIKFIGLVILFFWISFFASIAGVLRPFIFIYAAVFLFFISFFLTKNPLKSIFNKKEIAFWTFLFTMAGGIISAKNRTIAFQHFWFFIFPVPFLYFFSKISVQEKCGFLIIRNICRAASLVSIAGIIEFITKQNLIYTIFFNNIYYLEFIGRRIMSFHIHPAVLGTFFVATFPLAVILFLKENRVVLKLLAAIYVLLIFVGTVFTFSRGALFGIFAGIFVAVFFLARREKKFLFCLLICLLVLIIIFSSLLNYSNNNFNRIFFRYSFEGLFRNNFFLFKTSRLIMSEKLIMDYPFLGVGFGNYRVFFDCYLPDLANRVDYDNKVADCMYLTLLTETGLIGFGGFIVFIYFLLQRISRYLNSLSTTESRLFPVAFLCGFIGMMCNFLTYDALYWAAPAYLFWIYAGILASFSRSD